MIGSRRLYLVLLFALLLPLQSIAGLLMTGEKCPMEHESMQSMECCEREALPSGKQPCADMLKCSTANLPLLDTPRLKLAFLASKQGGMVLAPATLPPTPLAAPWRPPRV